MRNRFELDFPIMQTPMRGITDPQLTIAVSKAGGIGSLDATDISAKQLANHIDTIRRATDKPFCIHLTVPQPFEATLDQVAIVKQAIRPFFLAKGLDDPELVEPYAENFSEQMQVILDKAVPIFQFSCGVPALNWITKLKHQNTYVIGTATHLDEAELLQKIGVDAIVAQALEAYGERTTFMGEPHQAMVPRDLLATQLKEKLSIPFIINGGIATNDEASQTYASGAAMIQLALPLLACEESGLGDAVRDKLFCEKPDTAFSNAVTGRLARVLRCEVVDELLHYKPFMLPYPLQYALMKPLIMQGDIYFTEALTTVPKRQSVSQLLQSFTVRDLVSA